MKTLEEPMYALETALEKAIINNDVVVFNAIHERSDQSAQEPVIHCHSKKEQAARRGPFTLQLS